MQSSKVHWRSLNITILQNGTNNSTYLIQCLTIREKDMWCYLFIFCVFPGNCSTHNDFQTLVISVGSVGNLLSNDAVNDFKLLIERLIGNGVLNSKATSIVLKTISVLDNPLFSHINTNVIRKLMLLCAENMDQMPPGFFPTIRKVNFNIIYK